MTLSQIFSFGTLNPVMVIESPYNSTQNTTYLYKNAQTDGIINNSIKLNTTQIYRRVYNPNINQSYVDINGDKVSTTAQTSGYYSNPVSMVLGNHASATRTFGGFLANL